MTDDPLHSRSAIVNKIETIPTAARHSSISKHGSQVGEDARCPTCQCNWAFTPPAKCHGSNHFRCINCKAVFTDEMIAAPAMLAALTRAERSISQHNEDRHLPENQANPCDWDFGEFHGGTLDAIRAAIKQAKGA